MRLFRSTGASDIRAYFPGVRDPRGWTLENPAVFQHVSSPSTGVFSIPKASSAVNDPKWLLFEGLGGVEYKFHSDYGDVAVKAYDFISYHGAPDSYSTPFLDATAKSGKDLSIVPPVTTFVLLRFQLSSANVAFRATISPRPEPFDSEPHWFGDAAHLMTRQDLLADGRVREFLTLGEMGRKHRLEVPPQVPALCTGVWASAVDCDAEFIVKATAESLSELFRKRNPQEHLVSSYDIDAQYGLFGRTTGFAARLRFLLKFDEPSPGNSVWIRTDYENTCAVWINGAKVYDNGGSLVFNFKTGWNDVLVLLAVDSSAAFQFGILDGHGIDREQLLPFAQNSTAEDEELPVPIEALSASLLPNDSLEHDGSWSAIVKTGNMNGVHLEAAKPPADGDDGFKMSVVNEEGQVTLKIGVEDGFSCRLFPLTRMRGGDNLLGISVSSRVVSWRLNDDEAGCLVVENLDPELRGNGTGHAKFFSRCLTTAEFRLAFTML